MKKLKVRVFLLMATYIIADVTKKVNDRRLIELAKKEQRVIIDI